MNKHTKMKFFLISILGLMLVLVACGGSNAEPTPEPPAPAEAPATEAPTAVPTATTAAPEATTAPVATSAAVEEVAAPETEATTGIIVAVNAEFRPFVFIDENGDMAGFDVDLMNALSAAGNFEFGYENRPFDGMLEALAAGEYDAAISAITITDARSEMVDFTAPYFRPGQAPVSFFSSGQGLAVRTDEANIVGVESLTEGVTVGVKSGTTGDEFVSTLTGVTIMRYEEAPQALDALVEGTVNAVVVDVAVMTDYILQSDGAVKLVGGLITEEEYGIAVNKERGDVREMLDAALVQIREDGTYDQIFAKWFGTP